MTAILYSKALGHGYKVVTIALFVWVTDGISCLIINMFIHNLTKHPTWLSKGIPSVFYGGWFVRLSRCRDVALSRCRVVALSRCRDVALSRCRDVALSRCRAVALSRCRDVALSRCRAVALSRCRVVAFRWACADNLDNRHLNEFKDMEKILSIKLHTFSTSANIFLKYSYIFISYIYTFYINKISIIYN